MGTSKGTAFTGPQLAHYEECMRTIPAILMARFDDRNADAEVLFAALADHAETLGLSPGQGWGVCSSAAMNWLTQSFTAHGEAAHQTPQELLRDAIDCVNYWVDL